MIFMNQQIKCDDQLMKGVLFTLILLFLFYMIWKRQQPISMKVIPLSDRDYGILRQELCCIKQKGFNWFQPEKQKVLLTSNFSQWVKPISNVENWNIFFLPHRLLGFHILGKYIMIMDGK